MTKTSKSARASRDKDRQPDINLQPVEVIDLARVNRLERASFPSDEAASSLDIDYRAHVAKHLCFVAFVDGNKDFIGYVIGTGAPDETRHVTPDMMKNHDAFGHVLCIHSVVVEPALRRQGYGKAMLTAYLKQIRQHTTMKKVILLSKRPTIPFYEQLGFQVQGPSPIRLGKDTWIEMTQDLS